MTSATAPTMLLRMVHNHLNRLKPLPWKKPKAEWQKTLLHNVFLSSNSLPIAQKLFQTSKKNCILVTLRNQNSKISTPFDSI